MLVPFMASRIPLSGVKIRKNFRFFLQFTTSGAQEDVGGVLALDDLPQLLLCIYSTSALRSLQLPVNLKIKCIAMLRIVQVDKDISSINGVVIMSDINRNCTDARVIWGHRLWCCTRKIGVISYCSCSTKFI